MTHALDRAVAALMREVAAEIMLPRFRDLATHEIMEKEPGDLVTVVDRAAEARLTAGLSAILPEARVIGEEATAADLALLDGLDRGAAWIVDPLDGTANYAAGRPPFAIMIALAIDGATEAGWILDPLSGRLCHAARGGGAFIDGERIAARGTGAALPVAAFTSRYLPAELRDDFDARSAGRFALVDIPGCAGEQYPRVVLGENDLALFWRAWPWDHAPGALFLEEAGGKLARFDGSPYRVASREKGLLAAASPALWDAAAKVLFG